MKDIMTQLILMQKKKKRAPQKKTTKVVIMPQNQPPAPNVQKIENTDLLKILQQQVSGHK
jgi:hypothetical protein